MQSMLLLTVDKVEATSGRGGSSDDFSISEIMVNSTEANHWVQPDGSVVVYVAKGDVVDFQLKQSAEEALYKVLVQRSQLRWFIRLDM